MFKRTVLFIGAACALFSGVKAQEKVTVDKVIAVVGTSGILYSDVYNLSQLFIQESRRMGYTDERDPMSRALETLLTNKLLFQQALLDSIPISNDMISKAVETEIRDKVNEAGSIADLEKRDGRPIFDIRQNLTTQYEEQAYANGMRSDIESKIRVTPGEVDRYFKSLSEDKLPIVPEQYVYAQIAKYPVGMEEAKFKARETMLGYKERIQKGEMSFESVAALYSDDDDSRRMGGELPATPLQYLDPTIANAVENLKPGQLSDVVESSYGFELLQLVSKDAGNYKVKRILRRPVYSSEDLAATDKILDSLAHLIRIDSLTFEAAAEQYSDDKYSKMNGGIVSNLEIIENVPYLASNPTTKHKAEDIPIIQDVVMLRTLKPGEMSEPYSSTDLNKNTMRKILKLVEVIPAHKANLKDDYLIIEQEALKNKQMKEFEKWMTEKIAKMYVRIDPEYHYDDFDIKAWFDK